MKSRTGELFALLSCVMWALFPIFAGPDLNPFRPFFSASLSTLFAVIPLSLLISIEGKWHEIHKQEAWPSIIFGSIIVGVLFYGLIFTGAQHTNPVNVSFLGLLEVLSSFLLLHVFGNEKTSRQEIVGAALMLTGAIILLFPGKLEINLGDILVIIACGIAPYGNLFFKRARMQVSSSVVIWMRSMLSGFILLLFAFTFEEVPSSESFRKGAVYLLMNGIFIMGLGKILWNEAIFRLPIPKATSFMCVVPGCTLLFSFVLIDRVPAVNELIALAPITTGLLLLVWGPRPS